VGDSDQRGLNCPRQQEKWLGLTPAGLRGVADGGSKSQPSETAADGGLG